MEDAAVEEVAEPSAVAPVTRPSRLTVNGITCKRVLVEFGKDTIAFYPGNDATKGSVVERFWDQYDSTEDMDKYSRPRVFGDAFIDVVTSKGFLDVTVTWPGKTGQTKIVQANASLHYEEKQ